MFSASPLLAAFARRSRNEDEEQSHFGQTSSSEDHLSLQIVSVHDSLDPKVERCGLDDCIISKTVKEFPQHFRTRFVKANLQKCSRWWKDHDIILSPELAQKSISNTARSTAKKFNWGIQSPVASDLPVYAEQVAKAQADIATPTSMRTSLHQKNIHGRALEFVDDEAAEASSVSPTTD
ncbi:hypothetical protein R1sor_021280 [Riccia sorocarpa]|uniref:Uncharacterized protein n=1 Tax=Riccia sorocarpa TaxID=122646 RepID=A0ABD3GKV1_9MARC